MFFVFLSLLHGIGLGPLLMGLSRALDRADDQMVIRVENAPRMGGTAGIAHLAHPIVVLMIAMRANPTAKLRDVGLHGRAADRGDCLYDRRKFGENRARLGYLQGATAIPAGLGGSKPAADSANFLPDGLAVFGTGNRVCHIMSFPSPWSFPEGVVANPLQHAQ